MGVLYSVTSKCEALGLEHWLGRRGRCSVREGYAAVKAAGARRMYDIVFSVWRHVQIVVAKKDAIRSAPCRLKLSSTRHSFCSKET